MMRTQLKHSLILSLALPALGLASGAALAAGESHDKASPAPTTSVQQPMRGEDYDMRAKQLIGMKVHNVQGEDLGEVKDLIVDTDNERVHYAVLSFGGTAGLGAKHFAFPVSSFSPDADGKKLTLKVDKEKLKEAPGFARDQWPDWNSDAYRADLDRQLKRFGEVTHPRAPSEHLARASKLIGKDVKDRDGKKVGEIQDLVVDIGKGRVHYAVLDFDKAWSTEDKLLPVSLKSLQLSPRDRRMDVVMKTTREQLDMSRGFAKNEWPDINNPAFQRDIDRYLSQEGVAGPSGPTIKHQKGESGSAMKKNEH
jgi:sporulation protein YlmC with PRC-barrel domain